MVIGHPPPSLLIIYVEILEFLNGYTLVLMVAVRPDFELVKHYKTMSHMVIGHWLRRLLSHKHLTGRWLFGWFIHFLETFDEWRVYIVDLISLRMIMNNVITLYIYCIKICLYLYILQLLFLEYVTQRNEVNVSFSPECENFL